MTAGRQLLVFNLSPLGTLALLHPQEGPPGDDTGETVYVPAVQRAKFKGVEHVIAVSADDPARMHELIAWTIETSRAHGMLGSKGDFLEQLTAVGDEAGVRAGIQRYRDAGSTSPCIGPIPKTDFEATLRTGIS